MGKEAAPGTERRFDPLPPEALVTYSFLMWQMPLVMFTCWCRGVRDLFASPEEEAARAREELEHEQLVIPDPIEEAGERALFA